MKRLTIIYHSQSGATETLAQAVVRGAAGEPDIDVCCVRAMQASAADLACSDAVLFGSPENFGYLSGGLKDFFDRSYYVLLEQQLNIAYGVFISAGNDGRGAVTQLQRIVAGYPLKQVAEPLICRGSPTAKSLLECEELGATFAAGLAMGIF